MSKTEEKLTKRSREVDLLEARLWAHAQAIAEDVRRLRRAQRSLGALRRAAVKKRRAS